MAKDIRYKTIYFSNGELLEAIEKWMKGNKITVFNTAVLRLVSLGLGEGRAGYSGVPDKHIRAIVRDEFQKIRKEFVNEQ